LPSARACAAASAPLPLLIASGTMLLLHLPARLVRPLLPVHDHRLWL
jgi:hypothetical protein